METKIAYIALGANIGDTLANLRSALKILDDGDNCSAVAISSLYTTKAVGVEDQPDFINAVIKVKTLLSPNELLKLCNDIERKLGRERTIRWGPRVIDIDILVYNDAIVNEENLVIPHPRMMERAFVLVPLAEIAPDLILPGGVKASDAAVAISTDGIIRMERGSWSN